MLESNYRLVYDSNTHTLLRGNYTRERVLSVASSTGSYDIDNAQIRRTIAIIYL